MDTNVTAAFQQHLAQRRENIYKMFKNPQDALGDEVVKSETDDIEKAVYADNAQNRKLGRVGQEYGGKGSRGGKTDEGGWGSNSAKKVVNNIQRDKSSNIGNRIISALKADQGGLNNSSAGKKAQMDIISAAENFMKKNPKVKFSDEDLENIVGGDIDEVEEKYGELKGWNELNNAIESYFDAEEDVEKGCGDGDKTIEKEAEDEEDEDADAEDWDEKTDAEKAEIINIIGIEQLDTWKAQVDELAMDDTMDETEKAEAISAIDSELDEFAKMSDIQKSDILYALSGYESKIKFRKNGKEIKEQLNTSVIPALNADLSSAQNKADELLKECGAAPTHDVPEYWTGELHIELPYKFYEWDETRVPETQSVGVIASFSPDSYQKRCCKNAPASQEEAEARCQYNEQIRKVANITTDIKACEIVSRNLKDNESIELTVRQLVAFKFA